MRQGAVAKEPGLSATCHATYPALCWDSHHQRSIVAVVTRVTAEIDSSDRGGGNGGRNGHSSIVAIPKASEAANSERN